MADDHAFVKGVENALKILRQIKAAAASSERKAAARIAQMRREAAILRSNRGKIVAAPSWLKWDPGRRVWAKAKAAVHKSELDAMEKRAEAIEKQINEIREAEARKALERREFRELVSVLLKARNSVSSLGPMPESIKQEAQKAISSLRNATGRRRRNLAAVSEAARQIASVAERWVEARARQSIESQSKPKRLPAPARAPTDIYLPISVGLRHQAIKAGAKYDPEGGTGSRMYVPKGGVLLPLNDFLPLAFRQRPLNLSFAEIPLHSRRQNLWTMFSERTWDHVRQANFAMTGRRCIICGNRTEGPEDLVGKQDSVDCHEVWNWTVPSSENGVGIQKLRGFLTVCHFCHMMFHEGFFEERLRKLYPDDVVKKFLDGLMDRRRVFTRMPIEAITAQIEKEKAILKSKARVKDWIVDLSHLSQQDYMRHVKPTFLLGNKAGVSPFQIAGLAFVATDGTEWPARNVREVYEEAVRAAQGLKRPEQPKAFERTSVRV